MHENSKKSLEVNLREKSASDSLLRRYTLHSGFRDGDNEIIMQSFYEEFNLVRNTEGN